MVLSSFESLLWYIIYTETTSVSTILLHVRAAVSGKIVNPLQQTMRPKHFVSSDTFSLLLV